VGGINFGWLAVWVLSPDWLSCKLKVCDSVRRLGEAAVPWGGCPVFALYTLAFVLQLRRKNLSQGNRKVLSLSVPNAICLVDLAIASNGLDWPTVPCRPWLSHQAMGSTLSQLKCLPSCRTRGSPCQLTLNQSLLSGL
jgi:hypothetical protein